MPRIPRYLTEAELNAAAQWQREFDALVGGILDEILQPYGFARVVQNPGVGMRQNGAITRSIVYESDPDEYARRYPLLRARFHGDVPCIDLWLHEDPDTGHIAAELEGEDIAKIARDVGADHEADELARAATKGPVAQLRAIAETLDAALKRCDEDPSP